MQVIRNLWLVLICITHFVFSQEISGTVRNQSDLKEIAFASIYYKKVGVGTYADTAGCFTLRKIFLNTLIISAIGFEKISIPVTQNFRVLSFRYCP